MGFSYHELKRIKKNSIVLEKKENIEIQQNCTGFSRKKSTFIRERFFCAPTNSCRRKCNEHQKERIKGKLSKHSVDIQKQLKDSLVLEEDLQERLEEKVQNTCYQLANLEEDINHEIEKLQVGNDFLLEAFSGMEQNFCEKNINKFNRDEKTWAEHLAHNSCACKDIAKERFSLQHQCISTSPRYGDDEHLAPRPRMRSVASQVTTAIESLDQGALGDHKKLSNLNIKKENKVKDYKEHVTQNLQKDPQISGQNNFTVNCCSGMSQPPYCSYDVYSKVPPNGVGSYYYNCHRPEVVEGTPPNIYLRNEYYYDCTKCGSNSHNKRTCNSPSIKIPIRRQNTDLNTDFFCSHTKDGSELQTTKEISHKNKNANKEKVYNERKSRVNEKTKEQTTKRNRSNNSRRSNSRNKVENKIAKGDNLDKFKSEEFVKILRNLDRYVDERDRELKLKRKQIADGYSSTPTTSKVRSEAKLFQVMLCKKISNTEKEMLPGSYDSLSLGSQYSAKTLQMIKQMKIRVYKPAKPLKGVTEDDTDDEKRRQEKFKKYQQYCEKYEKECLAQEPVKVLKEPERNFGERASHEMDLFKQQKEKLKDSSERQEDFHEEMQTVKEEDHRNKSYNPDNPKSSQKNDRKENTNLAKVQDQPKTAEESTGYEKFQYNQGEARRGLNGRNDHDMHRHPYNNGKYNRDFHEDGRDKERIIRTFDYTDGDSVNVETSDRYKQPYNNGKYTRDFSEDARDKTRIKKSFNDTGPDSANKARDSLEQGQRLIKSKLAKNNDEELYSRKENGQRIANVNGFKQETDENSHSTRERPYKYEKERNHYSPTEDYQFEMQRDDNVRREAETQQIRKDLENIKKNVNEFKNGIDENSHRAKQRQREYDKEANYYSPNEDSQLEMQRDANVVEREIEEPQMQKDLEKDKIDVRSHRAKQRPYKYDKEGKTYSPNEDSHFPMQRDANVRKKEFEERQIRQDLEKTKKNVNEFEPALDENSHRAKQRPYKYDKEGKTLSSNEDSQFQTQKDANVRKREIEDPQIRKVLEENKVNVDEFERALDKNGHRAKQRPYKYDKEGNYYSPNEDSEFQMQRDANVRKREFEERQIRQDLEKTKKNVNEFERALDENSHRAKQRPYKYDKEGKTYSPNEDSQFQMQRDVNVRKREIKDPQIRKVFEENKKNVDEFERALNENGHRAKQRPYKYDKEGNYYSPNEDSEFQMRRDANVRKRELEERQIRKDLEKNEMTPISNLAEETLHSPEWGRQQMIQKEEGKEAKPTRHISRKQPRDVYEKKQEDIQITRLPTDIPKTEKEHLFEYEQDEDPTEAISPPPPPPTLKKDNKNFLKEIPYDEDVGSSYKDFERVMDHHLGIYTHRSSQTESNSPTEPNDKYSQRTFSLEQDSGQSSLMPSTTEDALKYLNNFLQIYQQQTGMQQKCLNSVTTAAYNLITKLSSCKNISPVLGNSEILETPKNVKEPSKSLEDKATSTALEEKLTQDVVYKDPKSTPDASAAQFKQKFEEPIESRKNVFKAANENDNFLSAKSNDPELENPNVMEELTPHTFDPNLETNERFEDETYQSPDNLEFWDTVENYQRYQECKDDSLNSFAQQPAEFPSGQSPTYNDMNYEPEYYETYTERPYRDLPTSSRQPIFDPDIMPAKGILKPYRVAENPQEEFCDFETYTSASMVSADQKDEINVKQGFSITCSKGQENREQDSNEEMEVFVAKEKYLNPIEEQSYLEENPKYNQSTYHDCQLETKPELDNDPVIEPPTFKQCPCMWETYVKMMQNY